MSDENRVFMVASPKTKTETKTLMFQDQDRDSRVSRPRPRLWGSKTKTRPRLVKTGLATKTQVSRTPSLVCTHVYVEYLLVPPCVVEFKWCTDSSYCSDFTSWWVFSLFRCTTAAPSRDM